MKRKNVLEELKYTWRQKHEQILQYIDSLPIGEKNLQVRQIAKELNVE